MILYKEYIDDLILNLEPTIEAIVNLGAGYDTRLFRLKRALPIFELDQTINIKQKKKLIKKGLGDIPKNISLIGTDFSKNDLTKQLGDFNYDFSYETFFIMEAVTQYLEEKAIHETFEFLSKANKNSQLVFTYVRKDFIDGEEMYGWSSAYKKYVEKGIWKFGLLPNEVPEFLMKYGWTVIEDLSYEKISKSPNVKNRGLELKGVERIVFCKKE